ncbi:hypothetical protein ABMA28_011031 [Loxostege sticticalis]|uniref:Reverse transcriptase domain-containing protein n=1 Tax=Loxostege sticticalis TaxID=481309 RepID=A0ABD0S608_LOXSC
MDFITCDIQEPAPESMLYADDIELGSDNAHDLQKKLDSWVDKIESHGLRVSRSKTEYMVCNFGGAADVDHTISIDKKPLPKVQTFKYLGSVIASDANVEKDIDHRVNTAWMKWRSLSGVLCDPKMPIKIKGKIYKTVVRPAMMYGSECWTIKKAHEQKLHTTEMKMLRWAGGVTRLDKVRNEYVRGSFGVAPIAEKMRESRLRWYGHIMRRDENHPVRRALSIPERPKGRGRPPATWWSNVQNEIRKQNLEPQTTRSRTLWRKCTRRPDPK